MLPSPHFLFLFTPATGREREVNKYLWTHLDKSRQRKSDRFSQMMSFFAILQVIPISRFRIDVEMPGQLIAGEKVAHGAWTSMFIKMTSGLSKSAY